VKKAAQLAKLKEYHTETYPGKSDWTDQLFGSEKKGTYLDGKLQAELKALLGDLYEPLMQVRSDLQNSSRIQARLLDDIRVK